MHIIRSAVKDVHVHCLTGFILIERAVTVRHYVAMSIRGFIYRQGQPLIIIRLVRTDIPHLKEHQGEARCRRPLEHDRGILPVAEPCDTVYVFVSQIDTAVEGDLAVDHKYLAVIAVIIMRRDDRSDRRERLGMYALGFKQFGVSGRKCRHLAHAVVHYPHFDSRLCLADKHIEYAAPHIPLFNYEIFHEDVLLGLLELLKHGLKLLFAERKICDLCFVIDREAACLVQIFADIVRSRAVMLYLPDDILRLLQCSHGIFYLPFDHFGLHAVSDIGLRPP